MRRKISVLGSTGSIGRQTLDIADFHGLEVCAIAAGGNTELLEAQARKYRPQLAAVFDEAAARDMRTRMRDTDIKVVSGMQGLIQAASLESAETVVTAVVGTVGLLPTLAAIKCGKRIALANKETLVCAGELVMSAAREYGAEILPVDSEHSAIFQCLLGSGENRFKSIILTASGGPFRGMSLSDMRGVTREQALKNPNWSMGPKVSVDSATMMNKGLEFIEAMHLFSAKPEQIQVLVHPESIVHSMVEFEDNSVIAQLAVPDMRMPIQLALTYPARLHSPSGRLSLAGLKKLTFEEPDLSAFRCLALAIKTAGVRGTACAVMNAANEEAVRLFLEGKTGFNNIYELVSSALENIRNTEAPSPDDILEADAQARAFVREKA